MWNKREEEPVQPTAPPAAPSPPSVAPPSSAVAHAAERRETRGVGPSLSIVGDVTGEDDLTVLGRLEGTIDLPANSVTIGPSARVKADIRAKFVSVAGELSGNVVASEQIVIRHTATMHGNLAAPRVGLEDGCRFRGSVEMETPAPKKSEPPGRP